MESIIKKSGSEFRILEHTNAVYIAEQWVEEKLVCIEVGKVAIGRGYSKQEPAYYTIPSAEVFGRSPYDRSFPKRMVKEAWEYFNELKYKAIPPKGWEDVLN